MTTHGGSRNRSGPRAAMFSARSDQRQLKETVLSAAGYLGRIPKCPLPDLTDRELEVWNEAWRTPQAIQWIQEPWRWRTVGLWVRWTVKMEDPEAPAAVAAATTRLADQIGLTPAGLKENGWAIGTVEVSKSEQKQITTPKGGQTTESTNVRRLRA
ncbi:hypothetical protein [Rhodococcus pyridinivorans]|uniref:hypothetical protein n=1 Tax=Rhodococcus pyridinivorans TaxID=103816 RepID=UPI003AAD8429